MSSSSKHKQSDVDPNAANKDAHKNQDVKIKTTMNLDFLKNQRLKIDGTNLESWLYKLKRAYKTTNLSKAMIVNIDIEGKGERVPINPLENKAHWATIANFSEEDLEAALPKPQTEQTRRSIDLAHMYVTATLADELIGYIREKIEHPAIAVAAIGHHFQPVDHLSKHKLYSKIHTATMEQYHNNFDKMALEIQRASLQLRDLGETVSDSYLIDSLLHGLPDNKYGTIKEIIRQNGVPKLYGQIVTTIQSHLRNSMSTYGSSVASAMSMSDRKFHRISNTHSISRRAYDNIQRKASLNRQKTYLGRKRRFGNNASQQQRPSNNVYNRYPCRTCGKLGHWSRTCWKNTRARTNNFKPRSNNDMKCFNCGKRGHFSKDCRGKQRTYNKSRESNYLLTEVQGLRSEIASLLGTEDKKGPPTQPGRERQQLMMMSHIQRHNIQHDEDNIISFMVDSGCTQHLIERKEHFTELHSIRPLKIMVGIKGKTFTINKEGTVEATFTNTEGKKTRFKLMALYAPTAPTNFLSTSKLDSKGFELLQSKGKIHIFKNNEEIAVAIKRNGTFRVEAVNAVTPHHSCRSLLLHLVTKRKLEKFTATQTQIKNAKNKLKLFTTPKTCGYDTHMQQEPRGRTKSKAEILPEKDESKECISNTLFSAGYLDAHKLHRKMGHISLKKLLALQKSTTGGKPHKFPSKINCAACDLTKVKRPAMSKTQKLDLTLKKNYHTVHSDVKFPLPYSMRGYRGFVILVDSVSRFVTIYLIKHKSEVSDYIKEYFNKVMNSDMKPTHFCSDGGKEYINHTLYKFFQQRGVVFSPSPPYVPEKNSISERHIQTIMNATRANLKQAQLPDYFWSFAALSAAYTYNRCPHAFHNNNKTPYEIKTGKKPNISGLVTFGSIGVAHIAKQLRPKGGLADHGEYVRMLAYDKRESTYLVCTTEKKLKRLIVTKWYNNVYKFPKLTSSSLDTQALFSPTPTFKHINAYENLKLGRTPMVIEREQKKEEKLKSLRATRGEKAHVEHSKYGRILYSLEREPLTVHDIEDLPKSYDQAIKQSNKENEKWRKAISDEITSIENNKTWTLCKLPDTEDIKQVVDTKWVFRKKLSHDGKRILRYKARLCARGFTQTYGVNWFFSYAPTLSLKSLRCLLAISTKLGLKLHNIDISSAFLHGTMDCNVYLKLPQGHKPTKLQQTMIRKLGDKAVLKLNKGLYGLIQSPAIWSTTFMTYLKKIGFVPLITDPCILRKTDKNGKLLMCLGVYVDDVIIAFSDKLHLKKFLEEIGKKFTFKDLGKLQSVLGVQVIENSDGYSMHQQAYIDRLGQKFAIKKSKRARTPLRIEADMNKQAESVDVTTYRSLIGTLSYLSGGSRPDITYAVSALSSYATKPTNIHMEEALRLIRYVVNTKETMIKFSRYAPLLTGYADASYNSDPNTSRSVTGYVAFMAGAPVAWFSKKQRVTATSTCEAEYIALSALSKEIVHLTNILKEMKMKHEAIPVYSDSQSALSVALKHGTSQRSKSIRLCYHNVRQQHLNGEIKLLKVHTDVNPADLLTKSLSGPKTTKLRALILDENKVNECYMILNDSDTSATTESLTSLSSDYTNCVEPDIERLQELLLEIASEDLAVGSILNPIVINEEVKLPIPFQEALQEVKSVSDEEIQEVRQSIAERVKKRRTETQERDSIAKRVKRRRRTENKQE